jgi:D-glycero-D-manno-heptose 1,7-bisphosphate phosphatase
MPNSSPTQPCPRHRAVFIDRDGTLMEEVNYCRDPEKVRLFPGVPEALQSLRAAGFLTLIVTNQSGIARGTILPSEYEAVHQRLLALLGPGAIDDTFMCADSPDALSDRRKPAPGMLLEAAHRWNIDLSASFMVGDKEIDVECGIRAGSTSLLVRTGYGAQLTQTRAAHTAEHFPAAAAWILSSARERASECDPRL